MLVAFPREDELHKKVCAGQMTLARSSAHPFYRLDQSTRHGWLSVTCPIILPITFEPLIMQTSPD
jgi:hypothetical protein